MFVLGQKGEKLLRDAFYWLILPHCLQKPTRLADGLGLGGVLPFLLQGFAPINGFPASAITDFGHTYWEICVRCF